MIENFIAFMRAKGWHFFMVYGPQQNLIKYLENVFRGRGKAVLRKVNADWNLDLNKDDVL